MSSKPQRLTLRIAAYTCVALLFAAGAILWFVNQRATSSRPRTRRSTRAQFIADALLSDELGRVRFRAAGDRGSAAPSSMSSSSALSTQKGLCG